MNSRLVWKFIIIFEKNALLQYFWGKISISCLNRNSIDKHDLNQLRQFTEIAIITIILMNTYRLVWCNMDNLVVKVHRSVAACFFDLLWAFQWLHLEWPRQWCNGNRLLKLTTENSNANDFQLVKASSTWSHLERIFKLMLEKSLGSRRILWISFKKQITSGSMSVSKRQSGLFSNFAQRSQSALTIAATAKCITPFSGPSFSRRKM